MLIQRACCGVASHSRVDWSQRRPHLGGAVGAALLRVALKKEMGDTGFGQQDFEPYIIWAPGNAGSPRPSDLSPIFWDYLVASPVRYLHLLIRHIFRMYFSELCSRMLHSIESLAGNRVPFHSRRIGTELPVLLAIRWEYTHGEASQKKSAPSTSD